LRPTGFIRKPTARKLPAFLATPPARRHFHDSGVE
jgi:hypothetical protein